MLLWAWDYEWAVNEKYKGLIGAFDRSILPKESIKQYLWAEGNSLGFLWNAKIFLFSIRMFNSDGTEAEMCGNGITCFKICIIFLIFYTYLLKMYKKCDILYML